MKLSTKNTIDSLIGTPVVLLLNILAKVLGFFLRIDHSMKRAPKRIAVSKLMGMGSIIQATPLLKTIKASYPEAELILVTVAANKKFVEQISCVDRVIVIDDSGLGSLMVSVVGTLSFFWRNNIEHYLDLETYSNFSTIYSTLTLATNRIGYYRKEKNINLGIYTHMIYFNPRVPISKVYLQMGRLIGCQKIEESLFKFNVPLASLEEKIKASGHVFEKLIVVNPNASDLRLERRWPKKNFIDLISKLAAQNTKTVFALTGSPGEKNYVQSMAKELDLPNVWDTSGKLSIIELIALIQKSDIVITNDTGPMHIAFAQNKQCIALFGPASPNQYGSQNKGLSIYKNHYCSPCVHEFQLPPCRGNNICMKEIKVEEVMECFDILTNGKHAVHKIEQHITYIEQDTPLGLVRRLGHV